jgi:hypothetical protein
MELLTCNIARFSSPLIHFYFVAPTPQLRAAPKADAGFAPELPAIRLSRLQQRWTRNADGLRAASWEAV